MSAACSRGISLCGVVARFRLAGIAGNLRSITAWAHSNVLQGWPASTLCCALHVPCISAFTPADVCCLTLGFVEALAITAANHLHPVACCKHAEQVIMGRFVAQSLLDSSADCQRGWGHVWL